MLRDDVVLPVRRQVSPATDLAGATSCPRRIADPAFAVCGARHAAAAINVFAELSGPDRSAGIRAAVIRTEPGTRRGEALAGIHHAATTEISHRRAVEG